MVKIPMNTEESMSTSRRGFYTAVINGLSAVMGLVLAGPAAVYLLFQPKSGQQGSFVEVADITQLPEKKPEAVSFQRTRVDGWRTVEEKTTAWVVKLDAHNVVAYSPSCTHLGCAYHWDDQQGVFVCPCHTSLFSMDGKVMSGPAPRPLDRYAIKMDGNKLMVGNEIEKSKPA